MPSGARSRRPTSAYRCYPGRVERSPKRAVTLLLAMVLAGIVVGALASSARAQAPSPSPPPEAIPSPTEGQPQQPEPPPGPPAVPPLVRLYGDGGTPEIAVGLGYSSAAGFLAAGGFRYFVIDRLAPGIEGTYVSGGASNPAYGLLLASLRFVPLRTPTVALALTGRTGRVLLAQHADGWGAGGEVAVIITVSSGAALELGYEFLRLLPGSFCADLSSCVLQGPVIGLRFGW